MGREPEPVDDDSVFQGTEIRGGDRPADYIKGSDTGETWHLAPFALGDDDETDDEVGNA